MFDDEKVMYNPLIVQTKFMQDVVVSDDLNEGQHNDIRNMLEMYTGVLTNVPGQTSLVVYEGSKIENLYLKNLTVCILR